MHFVERITLNAFLLSFQVNMDDHIHYPARHIAVVAGKKKKLLGTRYVAHKETIKQELWITFKINVILMLYPICGSSNRTPSKFLLRGMSHIYGVATARKAVLVQEKLGALQKSSVNNPQKATVKMVGLKQQRKAGSKVIWYRRSTLAWDLVLLWQTIATHMFYAFCCLCSL